jgi:hypothetical protein
VSRKVFFFSLLLLPPLLLSSSSSSSSSTLRAYTFALALNEIKLIALFRARLRCIHPSRHERERERVQFCFENYILAEGNRERKSCLSLSISQSLSLFFLAKRKEEGRSRFFSSPSSKACRKICIADLIILLFDSITR